MNKRISTLTLTTFLILQIPTTIAATSSSDIHYATYTVTKTKATLESITPDLALKHLMDGNARFVNNRPMTRDLLKQAKATSLNGQFPAAVILSCMDSRGSPEIIFDQGLGDLFSVRVAGNVVDTDQMGGMEYATKVVGSKLVVVMGHTKCGAVKGACQGVTLGNLTALLNKIQPAVQQVKNTTKGDLDCNNYATEDKIARQNVLDMIEQIKMKSAIVRDQVANKQVLLVGAMHDLTSGKVIFFDENGQDILVK